MLNKSVGRRYAEAFFAIAQEQVKIDQFQQELAEAVETIISHEELKAYMAHVLIPPSEKKEVLAKLFSSRISDTTMNFLSIVVDKRRANHLEVIYDEYQAMADESRNILKAEVVSAKHVDKQDITQLEKALAAATGKKVRVEFSIDPTLIGGIKVRIGDRVIDASVVKRLDMLKSSLKRSKIS
ncbi:MAG: F0F1 ATP synthase subunit delta [Syntrophomonadaceae bacterium]|nr:F0F1 ATP synthase subunit delta [Syntrophomonadaceae bacterium]